MEDNEGKDGSDEDTEPINLGKLQFKLDYDFQKGEVVCVFFSFLLCIGGDNYSDEL